MAKPTISLDEAIGHHGNIVKYYRCAVMNQPRGWTQEQLAQAMNVSTRWVQEIEKMQYIQDINRRKALSIILGIPTDFLNIKEGIGTGWIREIERMENMQDIDRRKALLILLGLPTTLLNMEEFVQRHSIWIEPTILKSFENNIQSRWQNFYSSSNQIIEEGLLEQIEILEQFADNGEGNSKSINRILAQYYQLAGTLARDNFKYSRAKKYFREAFDTAKEAQSPDLMATSVARHGLVLLRQERRDEALHKYEEANELAKKAQPAVKAYIGSGLAEALACCGLQDQCYRTLDFAEKQLKEAENISLEEDIAFVNLTIQSLQDDRGECYVLVGQPRKGIEYLEKAESLLDHSFSRNHCRLLMQQAEAFLAAKEPDTCVEYAIEGLSIARILNSAGNIHWANEIHQKLLASPWKHEPIVGKLGIAIIDQ